MVESAFVELFSCLRCDVVDTFSVEPRASGQGDRESETIRFYPDFADREELSRSGPESDRDTSVRPFDGLHPDVVEPAEAPEIPQIPLHRARVEWPAHLCFKFHCQGGARNTDRSKG